MGEVREYASVRYRMRKHRLGYNAYDLLPARKRLMPMKDLADFQLELLKGGHQVLGISRIIKEEYEEQRKEMKKRKLQRQISKAAAVKEASYAHLQVAAEGE